MQINAPRAFTAAMFVLLLFGSFLRINANDIYGPTGGNILPVMGNDEPEEELDEVNARVARVSVISGDVRIRRPDSDEWETVTLNLPVVEGDEIVTETGARLELQLAKDQHLRISENSSFKLVTLSDEGAAVSLSSGTMHVRLRSFNKDRFFEIDAPKTTISLQSAGSYRVDAGAVGAAEVRVAALTGEARIYTETSGFTLKSGRRARLFIDGPTQGEWETGDALASMDGFDRWASDRDEAIALRLGAAYYDKYYDDDIYGADDLNDNGQWIHTREYGYVWRPYSSAIQSYADWSPYRYGHWRWIPPFGWTWVNDEPWGWATYHHGRWFHHNGYWHWSPYGYHRPSRSWWRPALVAITIIRNSICWYPLGYHHVTININRYYHRRNGDRRDDRGGRSRPGRIGDNVAVRGNGGRIPIERVPAGAVVGVDAKDFGKRGREIRRMPREVADTVITAKADDNIPQLPRREEIRSRLGRDIVAERPAVDLAAAQARVGTAKRTGAEPLDKELRNTRMFDGRPVRQPRVVDNSGAQPSQPTGVFERPAPSRSRPTVQSTGSPENSPAPVRSRSDRPTESSESAKPAIRRTEPPQRQVAPEQAPAEVTRPRREHQVVKDSPRSPPAEKQRDPSPPRTKEAPKSGAVPSKESPKPARRPEGASKKDS